MAVAQGSTAEPAYQQARKPLKSTANTLSILSVDPQPDFVAIVDQEVAERMPQIGDKCK